MDVQILIDKFQLKVFPSRFVKRIILWQLTTCYKCIPKDDCIIPICVNFIT